VVGVVCGVGHAGDRSAVGGVYPEIGGASVRNDFEGLSRCTNCNWDEVLGVGHISDWNLTVANHLVVHSLGLKSLSG